MNISEIPTHELKSDLADSRADILICNKALAIGVTEYSGGTVQSRIDKNQKIIEAIKEELARRGEL